MEQMQFGYSAIYIRFFYFLSKIEKTFKIFFSLFLSLNILKGVCKIVF